MCVVGSPGSYRSARCLGRGRIIGDYRCVASYADQLHEAKKAERAQIDDMWRTDDVIRMRKELAEQLRALKDLASMANLPELKAGA